MRRRMHAKLYACKAIACLVTISLLSSLHVDCYTNSYYLTAFSVTQKRSNNPIWTPSRSPILYSSINNNDKKYDECLISRPSSSSNRIKLSRLCRVSFSSLLPFVNSPSRIVGGDGNKNNSSIDDINIHNKTELMIEVEALRSRAKELRAEARKMEIEMKESRFSNQKNLIIEIDDMIELLIPDFMSIDKLSVANKLRSNRWSPEQVLLVIDRLYELRCQAIGQRTILSSSSPGSSGTSQKPNTFNIGDVQNNIAVNINQTEYELLGDVLNTIIEAAAILDTETKENSISETNSKKETYKTTNRRWTGRVEQAIRSRLNDLHRSDEAYRERIMATEINAIINTTSESVEEYIRRTLGKSMSNNNNNNNNNPDTTTSDIGNKSQLNVSRVMEQVALVPMWVPESFLPFLISSRSIPTSSKTTLGAKEVEIIKDDVLLGSRFYLTSSESIPGAAIFRGNFRTPLGSVDDTNHRNRTAIVFDEITNRMEAIPELKDRVQLFLMHDPEWVANRDAREPEPKPVVLALSKNVVPDEAKIDTGRIPEIVKKASFPASLLTSFFYSVSCFALNSKVYESVVNRNDFTLLLSSCLPVFVGVLAIQCIHEVAHYFVAKIRNMRIGRPIPIPSPQLGLFGCITPLRSYPPNRAAMLDFALAGSLSSAFVSIGCIMAGIMRTCYASTTAVASFPVLPAAVLKSSFLIGTLLSWFLPKMMTLPLAQPIPIHPLFVIGFSGLLSSALNLLPFFRLDGGRACYAAMGERQGIPISIATIFMLLSFPLRFASSPSTTTAAAAAAGGEGKAILGSAVGSRIGGSSLALIWTLIIVLFQRRPEIPPRDDVTEVDDIRRGTWFASFLLSVAILAPFPGSPGFL